MIAIDGNHDNKTYHSSLRGAVRLGVGAGNLGSQREKKPESKEPRQVKVLSTTPKYRLVKHLMGKTEVPLAPKRIASLCGAATDGLVALGVRPILVQGGSRIDGAQIYLADHLKEWPLCRTAVRLALRLCWPPSPT